MTFLTEFLTCLSFYNLGIICPNGDVILFDPQMHTYVNLVIYWFVLINLQVMGWSQEIPRSGTKRN